MADWPEGEPGKGLRSNFRPVADGSLVGSGPASMGIRSKIQEGVCLEFPWTRLFVRHDARPPELTGRTGPEDELVRRISDEWDVHMAGREEAECPGDLTDGILEAFVEEHGVEKLEELRDLLVVDDVMEEWKWSE